MAYENLCDVVKPCTEYRDTIYRESLLVQKAIALVLMKLAFGQSDCNVGKEFGMEKNNYFEIYKVGL